MSERERDWASYTKSVVERWENDCCRIFCIWLPIPNGLQIESDSPRIIERWKMTMNRNKLFGNSFHCRDTGNRTTLMASTLDKETNGRAAHNWRWWNELFVFLRLILSRTSNYSNIWNDCKPLAQRVQMHLVKVFDGVYFDFKFKFQAQSTQTHTEHRIEYSQSVCAIHS